MMSRTTFRLCAGLALVASTQAQAAEAQRCLNRGELRGLVAYVLPSVAEMVIERCKTRVPANAFLNTRGPQLVKGLRAGQSAAWPMARSAFIKLAGDEGEEMAEMIEALPESTAGPIVEKVVEDEFGSSFKVKDCADIDRVLGTMAPMQASNFVDLFTEVLIIGGRDDKDIPVCANP